MPSTLATTTTTTMSPTFKEVKQVIFQSTSDEAVRLFLTWVWMEWVHARRE
jgi:hypothetical protein